MTDSEIHERNRFLIISAMRVAGVAVVLAGILIVRGVIPGYAWAGVVVIVIGLINTFLVPQLLARRWRTPPKSGPE